MKHFLLIQKSSSLTDCIEIFLKPFKNISFDHVESVEESLKMLDSGKAFDCIFVGSSIILDGEVNNLTSRIQEILLKTHCQLVGTNKGLSKQSGFMYVHSMAPAKMIFHAIGEALQLSTEVDNSINYVEIPLEYLNHLQTTPCDIFFRLGTSEDNYTYVKRFNEFEEIDKEDIVKYDQKKIRSVYIPASVTNEFLNLISTSLLKRISISHNTSEQMEIAREALDYSSYVLSSFGIDSEPQAFVQEVVKSILSTLDKVDRKKINSFKEIIETKEDSYHKHVFLTATLVNSLLDEMSWEISLENRSALTYAAYFHNFFIHSERDILITDEAKLNNIDDNERRERIKNHAKLAHDFLLDIPGVPFNVPKLILEHHGSKQGVGFPQSKQNSTQLSSLFMIASDFALNFLIIHEEGNLEHIHEILKESLELYGKSNQKILEALQNCISEHLI